MSEQSWHVEVEKTDDDQYHIVLDRTAAVVVLTAMGAIAGPQNGPRGVVDALYFGLIDGGMFPAETLAFEDGDGYIRFPIAQDRLWETREEWRKKNERES